MKLEEIKEYLAQHICESMYMDREELEEETLFSDFGLESATLVKIIIKVNEKYLCDLTIEELLGHQTLKAATLHIYEKITLKIN